MRETDPMCPIAKESVVVNKNVIMFTIYLLLYIRLIVF